MSFGFGVGDFIKIIELVTQARKRFVDAPSQYNGIVNDLRNFSNVVQDIDVLLSGCEPGPEQRAKLQCVRDDSTSLLNDLLKQLDKDGAIGAPSTSMTRGVKKAWKRFNWDQNDVQDFRSRISVNLALLNAIEGNLSSQRSSRIQQDVHYLTERSNQQQRHEILKWIGTIDHGARQSQVFDEREEGTGEWLLSSDEFRKWIETKQEVLFCPGLRGAGKTFLASIVIDHLWGRFGNKSDVGIAYHYCDYRRQDQENAGVILASILKQLAQCLGSLPDALSTLYDKHKEKDTRPSSKEIATALESVASLHSRVFIVIDGLDECAAWKEILSQLRSLKGANTLVTSRAIPEIVNDKRLEGSSVLAIRASDTDVRNYLYCKMSKLDGLAMCDRQLQQDIAEAIVGSIGGMFLLARLHLDSLERKYLSSRGSVVRLKKALAALPTGSSAYDSAYLDVVERIEMQNQDERDLAKDILAWLTLAKRPLRVEELRAAVAVQEAGSHLYEENLIYMDYMVSVCAGLVTVDERSQSVSLIHYTTQEYLERTRAAWHPDADAAIAAPCITYLMSPAFDIEFVEVDEYSRVERADGQHYPLFDYAKEYGPLHARLAISEPPSVGRFISSESKMPGNCLLLAARRGSAQDEATAEWLIERGVSIDVRGTDRRTPFHYAAIHGWRRCVQLLLQRGASLHPDVRNMTPFHYTVKDDHEEVVRDFLEAGTPIDTPVTRGLYMPTYQQGRLVYAMRGGAQNPAREARTEKGLTCLHLAALVGSQHMTKFLLDHGANPNFPSDHGETPLHLAVRRDLYGLEWPRIVDLWNDPKFRIEAALGSADYDNSLEKYAATCAWDHKAMSRIASPLLEHLDVNVNARDVFGISPLHIAARGGISTNDSVRGFLDIPPLHIAPRGGDSSSYLVRKLIEKGAKISMRTKKDETPLLLAVRNGNLDVVTTLLRHGADLMDRDMNGLNALHYAARTGLLAILQSVVNSVPDTCLEVFLKSKDNHGKNALHHLLSKMIVDVTAVDFLLKWPVGINDLDNAGLTPIARYLGGFRFREVDGFPEVLRLLFERGADPSFETEEGLGLAHLVVGSSRDSVSILRSLQSWGVNLSARDKQGRTALHYIAIKGFLTADILRFLCDEVRLSAGLRDAHGKTPLDYAVEKTNEHDGREYLCTGRWTRTEKLLRGLQEET